MTDWSIRLLGILFNDRSARLRIESKTKGDSIGCPLWFVIGLGGRGDNYPLIRPNEVRITQTVVAR